MSAQANVRGHALRRRAAPLVAVDDLTLDGDTGAVATKVVRAEDPYLEGHYPTFPIYPGIFIIESLLQTHRAACEARGMEDPGTIAAVSSARFRMPFFPGDTLVLRTTIREAAADGSVEVRGHCEKDGVLAAKVTLVFAGRAA
jgi:3-hydroxyacyl-[acyl-carrier-protein] dehydratase